MDKPLNTFFKLNENTIVSNTDNFTDSFGGNRIFFFYNRPRIFFELFDT